MTRTDETVRGARRVVVECDEIGCDSREDVAAAEGETFADIWARLKEDGWRTKSVDMAGVKRPVWVHFCPSCVRAYAAGMQEKASPQRRLV